MLDIEAIKKRAEAATPGQLQTAETIGDGMFECPYCEGEGELDAEFFENYDGKPLTAIFYGIGPEVKAAQELYENAKTDILSLLDELERTRVAAMALRDRVRSAASWITSFQEVLDETQWLEDLK